MKNISELKRTPVIDLNTNNDEFKIKEAKSIEDLKQRFRDEMDKGCREWLDANPRKRKIPNGVTGYFDCHSLNAAINYGERYGWDRLYRNFSEYFFSKVGHLLYSNI